MERLQGSGRTPLRIYGPQPTYQTYKSPYGPKYALPSRTITLVFTSKLRMLTCCARRTTHLRNFWGLSYPKAIAYGTVFAGFGVSAGIFALFFFGEVPKVRNDILVKIPVIGDYWVREVPPEDNPF